MRLRKILLISKNSGLMGTPRLFPPSGTSPFEELTSEEFSHRPSAASSEVLSIRDRALIRKYGTPLHRDGFQREGWFTSP